MNLSLRLPVLQLLPTVFWRNPGVAVYLDGLIISTDYMTAFWNLPCAVYWQTPWCSEFAMNYTAGRVVAVPNLKA